MKTSEVPRMSCPKCGKEVDRASSPFGDYEVAPGCVSVCIYCGAVNLFDADLRLRKPTAMEMAGLKTQAEAWRQTCRIRNFISMQN